MAQSATAHFPFLWPINTTWLFHFKWGSGRIHCIWKWTLQPFNFDLFWAGAGHVTEKGSVCAGTAVIGFPSFINFHSGSRPDIRPFSEIVNDVLKWSGAAADTAHAYAVNVWKKGKALFIVFVVSNVRYVHIHKSFWLLVFDTKQVIATINNLNIGLTWQFFINY